MYYLLKQSDWGLENVSHTWQLSECGCSAWLWAGGLRLSPCGVFFMNCLGFIRGAWVPRVSIPGSQEEAARLFVT